MFEENWKPSDFNATKALIEDNAQILRFKVKSRNATVLTIEIVNQNYKAQKKSIRNALDVDFYLSSNLSSEIYSNYVDFETSLKAVRYKNISECIIISLVF